MLLSILVILIIGLVAYIHFIQGFFSATLSAILAVVSAFVAMSFQEVVVRSVLQGKLGDLAHSVVLVLLFAGTYMILRLLFDAAVPGNVQVPLSVDKIGAALMGVIAGVFAAGIFAIAAQALPFGPEVAGFSRYELGQPQSFSFSRPTANSVDAVVPDALKDEKLDPNTQRGLWIPADKIVIATASRVSSGGALAGAVPMSSVHPNLLDELFFQRLGIQTGGKHVAFNLDSDAQVQVVGLYSVPTLPQAESEYPKIPYVARWSQPPATSIKADGGNIILIARVLFAANAGDPDGNVRLAPASARLVAGGKNYLPIGTLDRGSAPLIRANRPDDFLIVPAGGVIDFVYYVRAEDLGVPSDVKSTVPWKVTEGVFLEAKRLGGVSLAGQEIKRSDPGIPTQTAMFRKADLPMPRGITRVTPAVAPAPGQTPTSAPLENIQSKLATQFLTEINVGRYEGTGGDVKFAGGSATIRDKKFAKLEVNPGPPLQGMGGGDFPVHDLWAPPDQKIVLISGVPPAGENADRWEWATKIEQFVLTDAGGATYQPRGAWAKVKQGTTDTLLARYSAEEPLTAIPKSDVTPTDVWIVFVVPVGTTLQELKIGDTRLAVVNLQVQ